MSSENTFLDIVRSVVRGQVRVVAKAVNKISRGVITPNAVTLTGLAGHILIAWLIVVGHPIRAAILLVVFGLFDTLDGELARLQGKANAKGMLLDSITDRAKEILIYTAMAYVISGSERPLMATWAVAACGTSLLVSYVNAWGEAVTARIHSNSHQANKAFRTGLMTFEVRMAVVFVGLLSGRIILAVVVVTVGAGLTAAYRLLNVTKQLA